MDDKKLLDFAARLMAFNTTNPPGNQPECITFLQSFFESNRIGCDVRYVEGIPSLIVTLTFPRKGPHVCWIGHWDVVPPGPLDAWTKTLPFNPKIINGKLYGRGACDMKTSVAAAAFATLDLSHVKKLGGTLVLAILGDEEAGGVKGAERLMEPLHKEYGFDFGLVGEPTGFKLKTARRGACWGTVIFKGIQAHAARPEDGDNPIHKMGRAIVALSGMKFSNIEKSICGKPTLSITTTRAGEKDNVIPHLAKAGFDIRSVPSQNRESIEKDLHDTLQASGLRKDDDYAIDL